MNSNLIDFNESKLAQFDDLANKLLESELKYFDFESVSDFYKSSWLMNFPLGTVWYCTGLDDGAEEFYAVIEYKNRKLKIQKRDNIEVKFEIE